MSIFRRPVLFLNFEDGVARTSFDIFTIHLQVAPLFAVEVGGGYEEGGKLKGTAVRVFTAMQIKLCA
jgi:hypothetical protein